MAHAHLSDLFEVVSQVLAVGVVAHSRLELSQDVPQVGLGLRPPGLVGGLRASPPPSHHTPGARTECQASSHRPVERQTESGDRLHLGAEQWRLGQAELPELVDVPQQSDVRQADWPHVRVLVIIQLRSDPQQRQPAGLEHRSERAVRHPT